MPLRDDGAVAGKIITSTSTSASFWLSVSISCTTRSVDSASTLLNRMRATCSVTSSGSALPISHSWTELEDGTSRPIRRTFFRGATGTSSGTALQNELRLKWNGKTASNAPEGSVLFVTQPLLHLMLRGCAIVPIVFISVERKDRGNNDGDHDDDGRSHRC